MIPSSVCLPWQTDAFRPAGKSAVACRQLHHATGHDRPPVSGEDPQVVVRMSPTLMEAIDAVAKTQKVNRSDAVRQLVERGLQDWVEEQR